MQKLFCSSGFIVTTFIMLILIEIDYSGFQTGPTFPTFSCVPHCPYFFLNMSYYHSLSKGLELFAECRPKVLQNAPKGAFCNTFDLH